jgi:hypothetical protein
MLSLVLVKASNAPLKSSLAAASSGSDLQLNNPTDGLYIRSYSVEIKHTMSSSGQSMLAKQGNSVLQNQKPKHHLLTSSCRSQHDQHFYASKTNDP